MPPAGRGLGHDRAGRDSGRKLGDRTARPGELEPGSFFDHPLYLRTVRAERTDAASTEEALAATRLVGCEPGAFILDAGCGNGRHALPLARAGYCVVAFDRSALLLAAGRRSAGRKRFHKSPAGCCWSSDTAAGSGGSSRLCALRDVVLVYSKNHLALAGPAEPVRRLTLDPTS